MYYKAETVRRFCVATLDFTEQMTADTYYKPWHWCVINGNKVAGFKVSGYLGKQYIVVPR
jgi:hypothetical protein